MHLEFNTYLRELTTSVAFARHYPSLSAVSLGAFEVSECPYPELGSVSSNASFVIASALNEQGQEGKRVLPSDVAQVITSLSKIDPSFTINIGGDGHLNAFPSPAMIERFIRGAIQSSGKLLVSEQPLNALMSGIEIMNPLIPLEVSWKSKYLLNRIAQNPECQTLLASGRQLVNDDFLMLLGLCSDPEIDVEPYLLGLGSRRNIPWYLERARQDISRVTQLYSGFPHSGPKFEPGTFLGTILSLRRSFLLARSHQRPDWFLDGLLKAVRAFYETYNRPQTRAKPELQFMILSKVLECVLSLNLFNHVDRAKFTDAAKSSG